MPIDVRISVVIPTHNPDPERLRRVLAGLRCQTFPSARWECILVNNASTRFPEEDFVQAELPACLRITSEPHLGLTAARMRGFREAKSELVVLTDDDNVLAPDYLEQTLSIFTEHPEVGAVGGKSLPEFELEPAMWTSEFFPLLALRDPGPEQMISHTLRPVGSAHNIYPACAPIGAGMALRRGAWQAWLKARAKGAALSDRCGTAQTSSGDNDIVFCVMRAGWAVGYFPQLSLQHLIPPQRLDPGYLARLNRGIQQSWTQVLALHDASPWPPLTRTGARLRQLKAWSRHQPWRSFAAGIRFAGDCGHFEGRIRR